MTNNQAVQSKGDLDGREAWDAVRWSAASTPSSQVLQEPLQHGASPGLGKGGAPLPVNQVNQVNQLAFHPCSVADGGWRI